MGSALCLVPGGMNGSKEDQIHFKTPVKVILRISQSSSGLTKSTERFPSKNSIGSGLPCEVRAGIFCGSASVLNSHSAVTVNRMKFLK